MSAGDAIFRQIQSTARSRAAATGSAAPTQEYLIRHVLESFLERLTRTAHGENFVLKGGILLAAYGMRRPTKDADANAVNADVSTAHLRTVVRDIAATDTTDGDVSTGDPIVPAPRTVRIEWVLGDPIELLGCAPETTVAEKGVTILERGITSTCWRDDIDIVQLAQHGLDTDALLRSARAVARYRRVRLEPVSPHLVGYGQLGQAKWAAWRRKERLETISEELLDHQVAPVAAILDPVFHTEPSTE